MSHLNYLNYLKYTSKLFSKRGLPIYLIHFVTQACTANCEHCLRGNWEYNVNNELTIDEIEKFSKNMGNILFMFITGGEPFLRDDLAEIFKIYYTNNSVQKIMMPSNGSLTEKCIKTTKEILKACPNLHLSVTISIDGLGEDHDRIRKHKGLFDKAIRTYKELRSLEKEFPNYNTNLTVTVSSFNQDKLLPLYDYLKKLSNNANIFNTLTRGDPKNPLAKGIDIAKFEEFSNVMDKDVRKSNISGFTNFPFSHFVDAKNLLSRRLIAKTAREKKWLLPCYAGSLSMVLLSEGDVYPCELLNKSLGNLRDYDYDIKKIWFSNKAEEVRKYIKREKCFCTHECFVTHNLLFNPRKFPLLLKEWGRLRWHNLIKNGQN